MREVVKQLFTSPISDSPGPFAALWSPDETTQPVRRLDAPLSGLDAVARQQTGAADSGKPTGHTNGRGKRYTFRVPSDDEDDIEEVTDFDFDEAEARAATPSHGHLHSSYAVPGNTDSSRPSKSPRKQQGAAQAYNSTPDYSLQQQQQYDGNSHINSSSRGASGRHPMQAVLQARTRQLQADALLMADKQQRRLHQQLQSVEQQLAVQLQEVQQQLQQKRARAAAADEESRQQRSAERVKRLQQVQRQQLALEQAQATALQEVKRAQEEAAAQARVAAAEAEARARRQLEEERTRRQAEAAAAAAAAAKAAEEAKAREEAANAAQQQQQQQQQHQQQQKPRDPAAAAARPPVSAPAAVSTASHVRSTAAALRYEQLLQQKLAEAEAAADELRNKPELKPQRRTLEKQITMAVSQISGTQQQVQAKTLQLSDVLRSCSTPQQQALAYLTLASRIVSQCDGQVQKIGSFAFPLAYVCVGVGAAVPAFMELLLAKLQQASPLLVPKYTMYSSDQSKDDWFEALGYKTVEDPKTHQQRRENNDEYVARITAVVLLYGAMVQVEAPGNPAGLAHGWSWLARCLNALPPTRPTATALMSFLSHAGYRMSQVYGRQFHKLMDHITHHYLPALEAKAAKDVDLRAVGTRLKLYVSSRQYTKEPEGRALKKVDESSYTRA